MAVQYGMLSMQWKRRTFQHRALKNSSLSQWTDSSQGRGKQQHIVTDTVRETFSLACVMGWVYSTDAPIWSRTCLSPGWLLLSHHQSGSQCVRCFIQDSWVYFWHLAGSSGAAGDLQKEVTIASHITNLPDHRRGLAYIKQPTTPAFREREKPRLSASCLHSTDERTRNLFQTRGKLQRDQSRGVVFLDAETEWFFNWWMFRGSTCDSTFISMSRLTYLRWWNLLLSNK